MIINCFTNGFANQISSVNRKTPKTCQWVFFQDNFNGITIFEDGHIWQTDVDRIHSTYRIGWLHEAKALRPENYSAAWNLRQKFDFILTHDDDLIERDPDKFRLCIRGGVTIPSEDWRMWPKSKNIAMLLSNKRETEGHKLRWEIAGKLKDIEVLQNVPKDILKDYRFSVVVEAAREGHLFTEHLLDSIALGCVPIYYGTRYISNYMDTTAIINISSVEDLKPIVNSMCIPNCAKHVYETLSPYIKSIQKNNLENYEVTEDWFTRNIFSKIFP